jgi:chondroitin AC lyase
MKSFVCLRSCALALAALVGLVAQSGACASASDISRAIAQFREFCLQNQPVDIKEAIGFAKGLREDGSWPDVDYVSKDRSAWPASGHVERILTMAKAAESPGTASSQKQVLTKAIHVALAYWQTRDLRCPNWWHNRIGVPLKLCQVALLLGDEFSKSEMDYLKMTVTTRSKVGDSTAQNRVWLAGINLMYGLVQRDEEAVAKHASTIFGEAVVSDGKEGIQPDWSFHQHGAQLQFGNYGASFAIDQVKWWTVLRGTPWAMPKPQQEVMRNYLLEGQNWAIWAGSMDISCCGRAFSPGFLKSKGDRIAEIMRRMPILDPSESSQYQAYSKRNAPGGTNDLVGFRCFWRSDYMTDRRKDFCVTLKMCSKRVKGSESLNGQNLSGYYLGDGATYIYRTGEEYTDIFPLWNWRMLPGVTCAQDQGPMPKFGSYQIKADFVGGSTDGQNGCAVLDYNRDGVSAKKSWFFAGDQVVCLGAGIKADARVKAPVATTVNQCLLRGDVRVNSGGSESKLEPGSHAYSDLKWVEHDGIRYTLIEGQKVVASVEHRTGNWSVVVKSPAMPKADVSGDVFSLSIEHGVQPSDGSYGYGIAPAASADRAAFEVLSNNDKLQAVRFGQGLVEAVFHTAGRLDCGSGHSVGADAPCLVVFDAGNQTAALADPTQSLRVIKLEIDGHEHEVQLPQGQEAGKSIIVK